jgi:Zn-dependent protease with chaperone function
VPYGLADDPAPFSAVASAPSRSTPRRKPAPPKRLSAAERRERATALVSGFKGEFARPRRGFGLLLMEFVVFLLILLLPLAYLAAIVITGAGFASLGYFGFALITHLRGRAVIPVALIVIGGLIGLGAVFCALLAPLFRGREEDDEGRRTLNPVHEPLLFSLVERLCDEVGAPKPTRIDVDCSPNASAALPPGLFRIGGGEIVLTIGLPLVAGLTANQLVGVLAHEFGHFTQRLSARLQSGIRSVLIWFAIAGSTSERFRESAEERQEADDWTVTPMLVVMIFLGIARGFIWLCFQLGCLVSMGLLRRQEFDADAYEYGVVGTDTFVATTKKLPHLTAGWHIGIQTAFEKAPMLEKFPEDLPGFAATLAADPSSDMKRFAKKSRKRATGLFDTHPADKDRIEAARRAAAEGTYHVDLPASALFANFDELCPNVTFDFFHGMLHGAISRRHMVPNEELLPLGRQIAGHDPNAIEKY